MRAWSRSTSPFTAVRTCSSAMPPISSSRVLSCSSSSWKCRTTRSTGSMRLTKSPGDIVFSQLFGRSRVDLFGPAALDQLAEPEEGRDVRDAGRLLHVVRHDDDRIARLELINQLLDALRGDRVERRRGLVHQDDFRFDR